MVDEGALRSGQKPGEEASCIILKSHRQKALVAVLQANVFGVQAAPSLAQPLLILLADLPISSPASLLTHCRGNHSLQPFVLSIGDQPFHL